MARHRPTRTLDSIESPFARTSGNTIGRIRIAVFGVFLAAILAVLAYEARSRNVPLFGQTGGGVSSCAGYDDGTVCFEPHCADSGTCRSNYCECRPQVNCNQNNASVDCNGGTNVFDQICYSMQDHAVNLTTCYAYNWYMECCSARAGAGGTSSCGETGYGQCQGATENGGTICLQQYAPCPATYCCYQSAQGAEIVEPACCSGLSCQAGQCQPDSVEDPGDLCGNGTCDFEESCDTCAQDCNRECADRCNNDGDPQNKIDDEDPGCYPCPECRVACVENPLNCSPDNAYDPDEDEADVCDDPAQLDLIAERETSGRMTAFLVAQGDGEWVRAPAGDNQCRQKFGEAVAWERTVNGNCQKGCFCREDAATFMNAKRCEIFACKQATHDAACCQNECENVKGKDNQACQTACVCETRLDKTVGEDAQACYYACIAEGPNSFESSPNKAYACATRDNGSSPTLENCCRAACVLDHCPLPDDDEDAGGGPDIGGGGVQAGFGLIGGPGGGDNPDDDDNGDGDNDDGVAGNKDGQDGGEDQDGADGSDIIAFISSQGSRALSASSVSSSAPVSSASSSFLFSSVSSGEMSSSSGFSSFSFSFSLATSSFSSVALTSASSGFSSAVISAPASTSTSTVPVATSTSALSSSSEALDSSSATVRSPEQSEREESSSPPILVTAYCGDGVLDRTSEECDDGNAANGDGCDARCSYEGPELVASAPVCGDGALDAREECDDGNRRDGDGCSATCLLEIGICGDGIVQSLLGEQCEQATHDPSLSYQCRGCLYYSLTCGDGKIDIAEECDDGVRNSTSPDADCRPDCHSYRCGDGILDSAERCDDGNRLGGDGCDLLCMTEGDTAIASARDADEIPFPSGPSRAFPGQLLAQQSQFAQYYPFGQPYGQFSQLQPLISAQPSTAQTGPAAIAVIGAGAAAGFGWVKRRKR